MKQKKQVKKLRLHRETLRALDAEELKGANGGSGPCNFTVTCFGTTCGTACCPVTE